MNKIMITAAAALIGMAGIATADTVNIGVGQEGRGYETAGKNLAARLGDRVATEIVNFEGSDDISRAVCDETVQVGIMQIDALYTRGKEGCRPRIVGSYGEEFVYMLVPENSDIGELHDMDGSSKILVDTIGSGTDLFWQTAVSIETGEHGNKSSWSQATPINDPIFIADAMASAGEIDAVLMVTTPDSTELKELIDSGWTLVKFKDKDIDDEQYNGDSLYPRDSAEIAGTGGWLSGNTAEKSYVVRSFFVLSEETSRDRRAFADIARAVKAVAKK